MKILSHLLVLSTGLIVGYILGITLKESPTNQMTAPTRDQPPGEDLGYTISEAIPSIDDYKGHDHDHDHDDHDHTHHQDEVISESVDLSSTVKSSAERTESNKPAALFYSQADIRHMNEMEYPPATKILQAIAKEDFSQMLEDFEQSDHYSADADAYTQQIRESISQQETLSQQIVSVECKANYCLIDLTGDDDEHLPKMIDQLSQQEWWQSYAYYGQNAQTNNSAIILLNVNSNTDFMDQDLNEELLLAEEQG